ncbi:MAG: RES family NAD+ phosphorylase [Pseudohaliea sp.]
MAKFTEPPGVEALRAIAPVLQRLPAGSTMTRLFFAGGEFPGSWDAFRCYGPTTSRFDHQLPDDEGRAHRQERGIMYLASGREAIPTCLAEVFQSTRVIDRHARDPVLGGFELAAPVTLLDLNGPFATAIGASMALHAGPRPRARRWAQQLYEAYPAIDGLLYCSSMYGNAPAIALFERAARAIPARPVFHRELRDAVMTNILNETARVIGYAVV